MENGSEKLAKCTAAIRGRGIVCHDSGLSAATRTDHSDIEGGCFENMVGRWERPGCPAGYSRKGHWEPSVRQILVKG